MTVKMTVAMFSARALKTGCSCAARWKRDDVKKIWLNNLNRLSRDFFFVERAEGYRRQMQSGPRFAEHLASAPQWTRAVSD